ncbi:hypothetical protein YTPLAS18_18640 [Nitrospira sp.]|nr:hypothetical protein YTPLAS18_18640 [Nitrospira sp.]
MRPIALCSLVASIFFLFSVANVGEAGAFDYGIGYGPNALSAFSLKGHLATGDWWAWLLWWFKQYATTWHNTPKGSVPIPGTLVLFGLGFGAVVAFREWKNRTR